MVRLLEIKLGGRPTLMLFEDVHWMDVSSWRVLTAMREALTPLVTIFTSRPQGSSSELTQMLGSPSASTPRKGDPASGTPGHAVRQMVRLEEMGYSDITMLMNNALDVSSVPVEVENLVVERAHGSPLWTIELIRSMVEDGIISAGRGEDGRMAVTVLQDLSKVAAIDSVEQLITAKFDLMPAAEAMLVKVASVIGPSFNIGLLRHIMGTVNLQANQSQMRDMLYSLCRAGVLSSKDSGSHDKYYFAHKFSHDVAYEQLAVELKTKLHVEIAEEIESAAREGRVPGSLTNKLLKVMGDAKKKNTSHIGALVTAASSSLAVLEQTGERVSHMSALATAAAADKVVASVSGAVKHTGAMLCSVGDAVGAVGDAVGSLFTSSSSADSRCSSKVKAETSAIAHGSDLAESSWSAMDETEENVRLSDDQIRLLQYHFLRGGDGEYACRRAVHYLLLAADLALKAVAADEARSLLEQALERAKKHESLSERCGLIQRRLGQCQIMLGDLSSARKSLHASLEVLDPERGNIRNLNNKELKRRLRQLRRFDLAATMPVRGGPIESKDDLLMMELGTTYELLSQIALGEQQHVKSEYHGLCAASFGMRLKTLQPLVPRAYALLFMMTATHGTGFSGRWRARRYARRYNHASDLLGLPGGQSFELLDMCAPSARSPSRSAM